MSFTGFQLGLSDDLLEASKKVIESSAEYKKFFDSVLKKFNVTSPEELDGEKKKEFFDYIDANWNGEDEKGKDGKKEETEEEVKKKSEVNEEIVLMDLKPSNYTKLKKELEKIERKVGFSTMEDGDTSLFITNIKDQSKTVKAIEDTLKKLKIREPKDVDFRRKA
jgi:hypothetical protein